MEIDYLLYFFLIFLNLIIATWLTGLMTALFELSWAKIKKLDPIKRQKLVERFTNILENRNIYRILIRSLALINLAILSIVIYRLSIILFFQYTNVYTEIFAGILAVIVFILITEIIGNGWLCSFEWSLLSISTPVLRVMTIIFKPIINLILHFQNRINKLSKNQSDEDKATTADEIISLVENDAHQLPELSTLEDSERQMIRGIFDLEESLVKEIMTPRVDIDALKIDASIDDIKEKIIETGHSRIPLYRERIDEIVGFIYAKDLLDEKKVNDAIGLEELLHPPVFIPETKNVSDLLEEFKDTKNHIAVIIDEYGGTAGIVTFEDILEEIVGEIQDEYDSDEDHSNYTIKDGGSLVTDARMPIDEINELLDLRISEEKDFDTIGGYVISELGRIPRMGEIVTLNDVKANIIAADARKISKLILTKLDNQIKEKYEIDQIPD